MGASAVLLIDDLATEIDAFVANVDSTRASDEPADLVLVLPTKGAVILDSIGAVGGQVVLSPLVYFASSGRTSSSSTNP